MAPPVIPTNCAIVTFFYAAAGQSGMCETTLGVSADSSIFNAGDLDNVSDEFESHVLAHMSSGVTYIGTDAKRHDGSHITNVRSTAGGTSGEMLPLTNALLVQKLTDTPGRSGRGHWWLPGVPSTQVKPDGTFESAYVTDFQNNLDTFTAALVSHDLTPWLFHPAGPLAAGSPITGFQLVNLISTSRDRLRN